MDEFAALEQEATLWRRFVSTGLVDGGAGLTYIARLRAVSDEMTGQAQVSIGHRAKD